MMKDETTCIRCALCASRCPTHAITMQRFDFQRECVTASRAQSRKFEEGTAKHASPAERP